jgi:hypothetical protein
MKKDIKNILSDHYLKDAYSPSYSSIQVVRSPLKEYGARQRDWFYKPEYDFSDIERAQDADSYLARAVQKKSQKFLLAGYEFIGENPKTVEYILKRIKQIEKASQKPFPILLLQTAADVDRFVNALWVFRRDKEKSGGKPYKVNGKTVDPIAGIFIAPFPSLQWKHNKNGKLTKIKQVINGVDTSPEFLPEDCIHFFTNRRPGYTVGSPPLFSALEDIRLLRKIEENVEDLIQTNLFPLFHYKIGNEKYPPGRNLQNGMSEEEEVQERLEYMPASGVYISSWRHEIQAIGSEGKALRIDYYLSYFKNRVFSALGMSATDFGESDSNNRSTAQTQSKSLTESVESMQQLMKCFIDTYLITPLLLESDFKFDVLKPENIVEIQFGKIDISEQSLKHNETNQLYQSNLLTHEEARKMIGKRPIKEEGSLNYNKFPNRVELAREAQAKAGAGTNAASNQYGSFRKKPASKKDYNLLDSGDELYAFLMEECVSARLVKSGANDYDSIAATYKELDGEVQSIIKNLKIYQDEFKLDFKLSLSLIKDDIETLLGETHE